MSASSDFKDKMLSSFLVLENQVATNSDIHAIRIEAIKRFEADGIPSKKNEDWKYTSLNPLLKNDFSIFPKKVEGLDFKDVKEHFIHEIDSYRIVFVDGIYSSYLSDTSHDDYDVCIMSSAIQQKRYKDTIDKYFNKSVNSSDQMSVLNSAFAREGAYIHIPKNKVPRKPIQIIHFSLGLGRPLFLQPRNLIALENGAHAKIIERHQNLSDSLVMTNSVSEIFLGESAHLDYYKIQNDSPLGALIDNTYISQEEQSTASVSTFSLGGNFIRNNLNLSQNGSHINSNLNGITILEGKQHTDHHTSVHHKCPNSESHQDYKGIFSDQSTGVFNGKVIVDKIAQKTNAFQQNSNIIVSDKAAVNAKPQLEIFADDVRCSHGCTIGQLDDESLFYFKSRGIPQKEAEALLMYAFGDSILTSIQIPELRQRIKLMIAKKLKVNLGFDF